eukprot:GDKI01017654.1.p1 GENE.GDKI01017654.1~~GDKI01017654.1.p1  ORF type:complete len:106 (+),score=1.47 GDKI01017654.1:74-391(+)
MSRQSTNKKSKVCMFASRLPLHEPTHAHVQRISSITHASAHMQVLPGPCAASRLANAMQYVQVTCSTIDGTRICHFESVRSGRIESQRDLEPPASPAHEEQKVSP